LQTLASSILHGLTNPFRAAVLVFSAGFFLRLIPEMIAYPYPIGYDVINYYIPVLTNFDSHWHTTSHEFPLYVYLLHLLYVAIGFSPHFTVLVSAAFMFGIFCVSIFVVGIRILKVRVAESIFLSVFVMVQLAILRTTWDLHKDIFSISLMLIAFSLIAANKQSVYSNKKVVASIILSSIITISDRMVGGLFSLSLLIYAFKSRDRIAVLSSIAALCIFFIALFTSSNLWNDLKYRLIEQRQSVILNIGINSGSYNPSDLLISFLVVNGLLIPSALLGLRLAKDSTILKVPLLISIFGSFSWILFPNDASLVANRWIILTGILLSIFSGYGFIILSKIIGVRKSALTCPVLLIVIVIFGIIGISYIALPYTSPLILYEVVRGSIGSFEPVSMQFNSVDIKDNQMLVSAIDWINNNTAPNSTIIGTSHLRGWMELMLDNGRTFHFFKSKENEVDYLRKIKFQNSYLIEFKGESPNLSEAIMDKVYNSKIINIYKVFLFPGQTRADTYETPIK
jgi:hypothetical protein